MGKSAVDCEIGAIRPKPAFRPLFEIATTRAGSGVALINQTPQTSNEPEASESCLWWRRRRVGCSLFAIDVRSPFARQVTNLLAMSWGRWGRAEVGLEHELGAYRRIRRQRGTGNVRREATEARVVIVGAPDSLIEKPKYVVENLNRISPDIRQ